MSCCQWNYAPDEFEPQEAICLCTKVNILSHSQLNLTFIKRPFLDQKPPGSWSQRTTRCLCSSPKEMIIRWCAPIPLHCPDPHCLQNTKSKPSIMLSAELESWEYGVSVCLHSESLLHCLQLDSFSSLLKYNICPSHILPSSRKCEFSPQSRDFGHTVNHLSVFRLDVQADSFIAPP